jgi:nicotinamidase/pyrazinamidase
VTYHHLKKIGWPKMTGSEAEHAKAEPTVTEFGPAAALLVIDLQNDFVDPKGSLYVPGSAEVVPIANRWIREAAQSGAVVVATKDWHPERTPHFWTDGGPWPPHCIAGTWGAEFPSAFLPVHSVVYKGKSGEDGYSAFFVRDHGTGESHPTDLAGLLRAEGVDRIVVIGVATEYCVKSTVLDAIDEGFETAVLTEAIRAVGLSPSDEERALAEMGGAGAIFA